VVCADCWGFRAPGQTGALIAAVIAIADRIKQLRCVFTLNSLNRIPAEKNTTKRGDQP